MILASLLIICLLFGAYAWLCGIEGGVAIMRLWPTAHSKKNVGNLFTPIWEITNVFLVFGFTALAVFFSNGLTEVAKAVLPSLVIGLISLILRSTIVMFIFYNNKPEGRHWYNVVFVLVSFLVPLSFGAAGIVLLSGKSFWDTAHGWALMITLLSGCATLAVAFANFINPRHFKMAAIWLNTTFMFSLLATICIFAREQAQLLGQLSLHSVRYMSILLLFLGISNIVLFVSDSWQKLWLVLSPIAFLTPVIFALINKPFLFYPSVTLEGAYAAHAYEVPGFIGLAILAPIMVFGLVLLAHLLTLSDPREKNIEG